MTKKDVEQRRALNNIYLDHMHTERQIDKQTYIQTAGQRWGGASGITG